MYIPKHFNLYELVPKRDYEMKTPWLLWALLDDRILITADQLRDRYGRANINTWYWLQEGAQYRGWRPLDSHVGAQFSQHKFGRALDIVFAGVTAEEVRADIKKNKDLFPLINSIEEGVDWLHVDCRNCERIKWFKP